MASLWHLYTRSLKSHPLRTRMIASGTLFSLGSCIAQHGIERRPLLAHEPRRTARMAFYGTVIFAPLVSGWLGLLERVRVPGNRIGTVALKVALDIGLWGPIIVGVFWTSTAVLEGRDFEGVKEKLEANYVGAISKSVMVFGPSQILNFSLVPVPHRMLFTQCVGLGWNTYLSYASSLPHPTALESSVLRAVESAEHALEGGVHALEKVEHALEGKAPGVARAVERGRGAVERGLSGREGERAEGLALEQIGI